MSSELSSTDLLLVTIRDLVATLTTVVSDPNLTIKQVCEKYPNLVGTTLFNARNILNDHPKIELLERADRGSEAYEVEQARLQKAFEKVSPSDNWKNPINATVLGQTEAELREIGEAVIHFTGSVPVITMLKTKGGVSNHRVTAAGYYRTIGS